MPMRDYFTRLAELRVEVDEIEATRTKTSDFMHSCPAICFIKDKSGIFVYANPIYQTKLKINPVGKRDVDVYPLEYAQKHVAEDLQVIANREAIIVIHKLPVEGKEETFLVVKFPIINGQIYVGGIAIGMPDSFRLPSK